MRQKAGESDPFDPKKRARNTNNLILITSTNRFYCSLLAFHWALQLRAEGSPSYRWTRPISMPCPWPHRYHRHLGLHGSIFVCSSFQSPRTKPRLIIIEQTRGDIIYIHYRLLYYVKENKTERSKNLWAPWSYPHISTSWFHRSRSSVASKSSSWFSTPSAPEVRVTHLQKYSRVIPEGSATDKAFQQDHIKRMYYTTCVISLNWQNR